MKEANNTIVLSDVLIGDVIWTKLTDNSDIYLLYNASIVSVVPHFRPDYRVRSCSRVPEPPVQCGRRNNV